MAGNICLVLLILCGIWSQGILGTFADQDITESSSFLDRQKRVVNLIPGEDRPVRIEDHPYIVNIKLRNRVFCVGSILSHRIIITAASCGNFDRSSYKVVSGSTRTNRAVVQHNVTDVLLHYGNHPNRGFDGIALFIIDPAIVYSSKSTKIDLHVGPVLPGMIGTVIGWGYIFRNRADQGTQFPQHLRSIQVPIMSHRDCVNRCQNYYVISDKDICTFHPYKRAGHSDTGAPLIMDNLLVGIFLQRGPPNYPHNTSDPDVFALLQHVDYNGWIRAHL